MQEFFMEKTHKFLYEKCGKRQTFLWEILLIRCAWGKCKSGFPHLWWKCPRVSFQIIESVFFVTVLKNTFYCGKIAIIKISERRSDKNEDHKGN